jgi:multiple sugar transport system permease protein
MNKIFRFRYFILAPAIFLILLVGFYPFLKLLVTSFQNITMFDDDFGFSGMVHYERLFEDSRFWNAVLRTLLFTAVALPIELLLGFFMAQLFLERMAFKQILVALLILPTVIAPIVAGSTWRLMFDNQFGPINQILSWIVGEQVELLWTINNHLVWPAILIADVWQWTPFTFLFLLTALSSVDQEQLEAAELDGASGWRIFRFIIFPSILPVVAIAALIRGLDLVRLFDVVWTMTRGGPGTRSETISMYAYQLAFREFDVSYSAALALLVIVVLTFLVLMFLRLVEVQR